jgi:hypothetical protein
MPILCSQSSICHSVVDPVHELGFHLLDLLSLFLLLVLLLVMVLEDLSLQLIETSAFLLLFLVGLLSLGEYLVRVRTPVGLAWLYPELPAMLLELSLQILLHVQLIRRVLTRKCRALVQVASVRTGATSAGRDILVFIEVAQYIVIHFQPILLAGHSHLATSIPIFMIWVIELCSLVHLSFIKETAIEGNYLVLASFYLRLHLLILEVRLLDPLMALSQLLCDVSVNLIVCSSCLQNAILTQVDSKPLNDVASQY